MNLLSRGHTDNCSLLFDRMTILTNYRATGLGFVGLNGERRSKKSICNV